MSLHLHPALISVRQRGDLTVKHEAAQLSRGSTDHSINRKGNITNKQGTESFCVAIATRLAFLNSEGKNYSTKKENATNKLDILIMLLYVPDQCFQKQPQPRPTTNHVKIAWAGKSSSRLLLFMLSEQRCQAGPLSSRLRDSHFTT